MSDILQSDTSIKSSDKERPKKSIFDVKEVKVIKILTLSLKKIWRKFRKVFLLLLVLASKRKFNCPYENCDRVFKEKGNLRTHLRVHVIILLILRQESDRLSAISKIVAKLSSLWAISKHTSAITQARNPMNARSAAKATRGSAGLKSTAERM